MRWVCKELGGAKASVDGKGVDNGGRKLLGKKVGSVGSVGAGRESVSPVSQHLLSIVVGVSGGGDAKVAEHSVGAPSAKKLDGVGVSPCTEKGGGATRAKTAGGK